MIAVDTETGQVLWSAEETGGVASPAVGPDGTIYTGGGASSLVALRPEDSVAELDDAQVARLKEVESALGVVLVAYDQP